MTPQSTTPLNPSTEAMATMSGVMRKLRERGYTVDFNLLTNCLVNSCDKDQKLSPSEFEVDESYRFEGESNPSDEAVVYAVSSKPFGLKGIVVNGYGIYSDPLVGEMAAKFKI